MLICTFWFSIYGLTSVSSTTRGSGFLHLIKTLSPFSGSLSEFNWGRSIDMLRCYHIKRLTQILLRSRNKSLIEATTKRPFRSYWVKSFIIWHLTIFVCETCLHLYYSSIKLTTLPQYGFNHARTFSPSSTMSGYSSIVWSANNSGESNCIWVRKRT